jgi:hypothetical protein
MNTSSKLLITVIAGMMASTFTVDALACRNCPTMTNNLTSLTNLHNALSQSIGAIEVQTKAGFISTAQALLKLQQDIVGAIAADSANVSYKLDATATANANLMDTYAKRMERIEKTRLEAQNNLDVEKDHGAKNIPANLCRMAGRIEVRGRVREAANNVISSMRQAQNSRRGSEGTEMVSTLTPGVTDLLPPISAINYPEDEAGALLDQVPYITGETSFTFSVDKAVEKLDDNAQRGVMSAWLRSTNASEVIAKDIAKRSVPIDAEGNIIKDESTGEDVVSIFGEYKKEVYENLSKKSLRELGSSGELKVLRKMAAAEAMHLKMQYERLETQADNNRLRASIVGFMVDKEARILEAAIRINRESK